MSDLGMAEDEIFKKRQQTEKMFADRNKLKKRREKRDNLMRSKSAPNFVLGGQYAPSVIITFYYLYLVFSLTKFVNAFYYRHQIQHFQYLIQDKLLKK